MLMRWTQLATNNPPICPPKPPTTWNPAPHRQLPPRPSPKVRKHVLPQLTRHHRPSRTPDDVLSALVNEYRQKRHDALDTIRHLKKSKEPDNIAATKDARAFLDTWRIKFELDLDKGIAALLHANSQGSGSGSGTQSQPAQSQPATQRAFENAVDQWRAKNASRLQAMSTAQLRLRYRASRVLRHAPDVVALMSTIDISDTTFTAAMALQAMLILQKDLRQPGNDEIIATLLDSPRLPNTGWDQPTAEELAQDDINSGPDGPGPIPPLPSIVSTLTWAHQAAHAINTSVRQYLEANRWNTLGSHFGALIVAITELIWPTIMNDDKAVTEELTPEAAVFISLLKATIAPDHTDDEDDAISWWEEMQLWLEEMDVKEIPPAIIRELADLHDLQLLKFAPQPELSEG